MLCLAAHVLADPEYARPICLGDAAMADMRLPWLVSRELGRSFLDGRVPAGEAPEPAWATRVPLDRFYYEKGGEASPAYLPCEHGVNNVPYEKTFALVVLRDRGSRAGQYLSIGGHNTGTYNEDVAGAVTAFYSHGHHWLGGAARRVPTARKYTSVCIARDGSGGPPPAYASLERAELKGD